MLALLVCVSVPAVVLLCLAICRERCATVWCGGSHSLHTAFQLVNNQLVPVNAAQARSSGAGVQIIPTAASSGPPALGAQAAPSAKVRPDPAGLVSVHIPVGKDAGGCLASFDCSLSVASSVRLENYFY